MKTKNNQKTQRFFTLLGCIALLAGLSGCSSNNSNNSNSSATPNVNRSTPQNTQAQQTPTPNPADALSGIWETRDNRVKPPTATTDFVRWRMNYAKEDKGVYSGDVTDVTSNQNVGTYTIYPNKSIKFDTPSIKTFSSTYDYDASADGNTLTLKTDTNPIVFKRGSTNTDILKDADTIHNSGNTWEPTNNTKTIIKDVYKITVDYAVFEKPIPSGEGFGGGLLLGEGTVTSPIATKPGKYIITSRNAVTLNIGAGNTSAKYALEQNGDILKINFNDGTEWVFNRK